MDLKSEEKGCRDGPTAEDKIHFRILATSDLHAHLLPYDYFTDQKTNRFGLARTASLIAKRRAEVANSLLFDNGDFLTGTPVADPDLDDTKDGSEPDNFVVVDAMNLLGFSAAAIGNHEFNYGLEVLQAHSARAAFPFLCANLTLPEAAQTTPPMWRSHITIPYSAQTENGAKQDLTIAVFGLTPPQSLNWDHSVLPGGIAARDMVETAQDLVPRLRSEGADIVIGLCHTGIGGPDAQPNMENALIPLSKVPGIDALVGGHTHVVFPEDGDAQGLLNGVPTVIPGFFGSHLGQIDLILSRGEGGQWSAAAGRAQVEPVHRPGRSAGSAGRVVRQDRNLIRRVQKAHKTTLNKIRQPLGYSQMPLHSYFALVAPDPTLDLVARAQTEVAIAGKASGRLPDLPILSAVAPFRAGGRSGPENYIDLPAGPLTMRNAAEHYQYPNHATVVELDLSGLSTWLERSAGLFNQIIPGTVHQALINPDFPSYNFDVIHGLTYQIDPTQPSRYSPTGALINPDARRVKDLRYQGRPVADSDRFLVVANSYRTGGGGGFPAIFDQSVLHETRRSVREILVSYLRSHREELTPPTPVWAFPILAGTVAQFDSGRGAMAHLPLQSGPNITSDGPGTNGFYRYSLHFGPR